MAEKSTKYFILMGDVVSSSSYEAKSLHKELKILIQSCNKELRADILSPYTITLGDEFQGIATSLEASIKTLFFMEEECLKQELDFKLHYALHFGEIETEINPNIAYEMMGPGLTKAREMLTSKKRSRKRFEFDLSNKRESLQFSRLFEVLDAIILSWKKEDYALILDMIKNENNAEVGEKHEKNRDQIWKRRKTLMVNEYNQLKNFMLTYIQSL
ncbi:MAG TPA: SatD family protein [Gracilimonas sp.]|uniref:SatD family protein n=1 Tax=Gracilimonas sp. TaxID=1974203 RepID=UPI002DA2DA8C|nr:SatD family protein [Gracilimonas sp.]